MPQMFPMNWTILFLSSFMMVVLFSSVLYFSLIQLPRPNSSFSVTPSNKTWTW